MSKPITMSEDIMNSLIGKVIQTFQKTKIVDGKVDVSVSLDDTNQRAELLFDPCAYTKMLSLVMNYDSEVAWHGIATREGNAFTIEDILVYPQVVSGATVNTDQKEYENWLMNLTDEVFRKLRMQGHSHVNMGTSPSGVDLTHQEKIVEQLEENDFYIFLIWNKKMSYTLKIFDMVSNTLYETKDIDVYVGGLPLESDDFLKDSKELVKSRTYTVPTIASSTKKQTKTKKNSFDEWWKELYDDI